MEKCIFTTEIEKSKEFDRLYFGNEFCERNIPTIEQIKQVNDFSKLNHIPFTLVTPYVTNFGIKKIKNIVNLLNNSPKQEIVINDFGVYQMLKKYNFKLILGRLLTKQRRGPDIINANIPTLSDKYIRSSMANNSLNILFLKKLKINHIEIDNTLQVPILPKIKTSLYYPFVYVTTTRKCKSQLMSTGNQFKLGVNNCNRECQEFALQNKIFPIELILKGNTIFYKNNKIPEINIDRLIKIEKIIV